LSAVHVVGLDHFLQNITDECMTDAGKKEERQQKLDLAAYLRKIIRTTESNSLRKRKA